MTDGIYTCDVDDYVFLLSKQDGAYTKSQNDWFYWWLRDNGIEPNVVAGVTYNELQETIYVEELDFEGSLRKTESGRLRLHRRGPHTVVKDYPVIEPPPQILMDRWGWLMEEFRGDERALCQTG